MSKTSEEKGRERRGRCQEEGIRAALAQRSTRCQSVWGKWGLGAAAEAPLKRASHQSKSCLFRFSHPQHWIIFNHGSACGRPAYWRTSASPCLHQPINCVHKHPPAGSQLAWGRGRSRVHGWDGQRVPPPFWEVP